MDTPPPLEGSKESDGGRPKISASSAPSPTSHKGSPRAPRLNGIPPKRASTAAQHISEPNSHSAIAASTPAPSPARSTTQKKPPQQASGPASTRCPTSTETGTAKLTKTTRLTTHARETKNQRVQNDILDGVKRSDISEYSKRISIPASALLNGEAKKACAVPGREYLSAAGTIPEIESGVSRTSSASPTKGRQQTPMPSVGTSSRPATSRLRTSSPMKIGTKSTKRLSRPTASNTAAAIDRPRLSGAGSMDDTPGADSKKRMSTIQASAAHSSPEKHSSRTVVAEPSKTIRPGLGTRKSTMSVSIGQRLHEMELVHHMLNAAMDENNSDTDEVKEGYVKKADEQLASLKAKLEDVQLDGANVKVALKRDDFEDSAERPSLNKSPSAIKEELGPSSIMHIEDINLMPTQRAGGPQQSDIVADNVAKHVQKASETDQGEYTAVIESWRADHAKDVKDLRSQLENAEHAAKTLAQVNAKHIQEREADENQKLKAVHAELAVVQFAYQRHQEESSREIEDLRNRNASINAEMAAMKSKNLEDIVKMHDGYKHQISKLEQMASCHAHEKAHLEQVQNELDEAKCKLATTVHQKDEAVEAKQKLIAEQEAEIEDLRIQRTWAKDELNAYGARLMAKEIEFREALATNAFLQKHNDKLEEQTKADAESFQARMRAKLDELGGTAKVIEHLQNSVKDLQIEVRETNTINTTAKEHIHGLEEQAVADSESLRAKVEELGETARVIEHLQSYIKELQNMASTSSRSCTELNELIQMKNIEISELMEVYNSSRAAIRDLEVSAAADASSYREENRLKDQKLEDLITENKVLCDRLRLTEAAMQGANEEINHLNEVVDDLQKMIHHVHVTTDRNLDDSRTKLIQGHEEILDQLRLDHLSAQTTFTEELMNAEKKHEEALSALRSKHREELENKETIIQRTIIELARVDTEAREMVKNMVEEAQAAARAHEAEQTALLDQLYAPKAELVKEVQLQLSPSASIPAPSDSGNASIGMSTDGSVSANTQIADRMLEHQPTQEVHELLRSQHQSVLGELARTQVELEELKAFAAQARESLDKYNTSIEAQLPGEAQRSKLAIPSMQRIDTGANTQRESLEEADYANTVSDKAEDLDFFDELCILEHLGATKHEELTDITKSLHPLRDEIVRAEELVMQSVPEGWLESCTESDARKLIGDALGQEECLRFRNEIRRLKAQLYYITANRSLGANSPAKIQRVSTSSFDPALTGGWGYQALQAAADAQQEENARLVEELRAAKESKDALNSKLKEMELTAKSSAREHTDTATYCGDTHQNGPLSLSVGLDRPSGGFAIMSDIDDEKEEREELGPRITGRVAGLRERIGQMKAEIDEDMVRTGKIYGKMGPDLVKTPVRSRDVSDQENFLPRYSP